MPRNEKTSKRVAGLASKGLRGKSLSPKQKKSIYASALTQSANKRKRK